MDLQVTLVVLILVGTLLAFVREWWPIDVTALTCLAALLATGLIDAREALTGFSNPAVITVMMLFVIGDAVTRTGAIARLGDWLTRRASSNPTGVWSTLMFLAGGVSSFVNNTAAMAVLMPVAMHLSRRTGVSASKLLIPLSYATIFGGTVTLIGTSTNVLVSAMAADRGLEPFTVFEFAWLGLPLLLIGITYNIVWLRRSVPDRESGGGLTGKYRLVPYLTEIRVPEESPLIGQTVLALRLGEQHGVQVLEILRGERRIASDLRNTPLMAGDILITRGNVEALVALREHFGLQLLSDTKLKDGDLADANNVLMELQLSAASSFEGRTLRGIDFRRRFGCYVLALSRQGEVLRDELAAVQLQRWDTLLVFGPRDRVEALLRDEDFSPLQEVDLPLGLTRGWWQVALAFPAVVVAATLGVPVEVAALLAVVALLLMRRTTLPRAYRAIDWQVIFLLAAILPLGLAIEKHGIAEAIGNSLGAIGAIGSPVLLLAATYIVTSLLTEMISNNAAAVLMVPIALTSAQVIGVDPKPLLMAVTFAASTSFLTPMGYQTNAMAYAPGGYRVLDYFWAGLPLLLIFASVSVFLIPRIWPF